MRTYSEPEIADILARAAERQTHASGTSARVGLTLDEIVRLGTDAGLDAGALRDAAAEVDGTGQTLRRQATNTATEVVVERWLDGPLTPEGWEDAVIELRQTLGPDMAAMMGMATQQQQIGRAFEWTHMSGLGVQTTVLASPRGDRTRFRMTQLLGFASPATSGVLSGSLVAAAAFGLTTAVAIPAATALDRRWRARKLHRLGELADRIAPVLVPPAASAEPAFAEPVVGEPVAEALASPAPSRGIDAGLLDADEPALDSNPSTAHRTRA